MILSVDNHVDTQCSHYVECVLLSYSNHFTVVCMGYLCLLLLSEVFVCVCGVESSGPSFSRVDWWVWTGVSHGGGGSTALISVLLVWDTSCFLSTSLTFSFSIRRCWSHPLCIHWLTKPNGISKEFIQTFCHLLILPYLYDFLSGRFFKNFTGCSFPFSYE